LAALYAATACIYLVLPVVGKIGNVLLGTAVFPYDSFLNAGILEWGYTALRTPGLHLFEWTAGFPLQNSLAVGENLVGWQILYTPLRLIGVGIPAAYNLLILISLVVSGLGAALLARRLGANRAGAAVAGLVFAFGPFHLNHMLQIQTMGVCWSPFAILYLDRYLASGSWKDASALAFFYVVSALFAMYFAVFLGFVLPLYAVLCWIFGRHRYSGRALGGLVTAGAISTVILLPLIVHYLQFASAHGYQHSEMTLANLSMELLAPLRTPEWQAVWSWSPLVRRAVFQNAQSFTATFPGVVALGLTVYAIVAGPRDRESRAVVAVLVSMALICYVLALGPILRILNMNFTRVSAFPWMPGRLWLLIPGVRWPMRIFFYAWLGGAVLCGLGTTALVRRVKPRWRVAIAVGVFLLLAIEYRPASWLAGRSALAPPPMTISDAYPYLAHERDKGGVVELPTAGSDGWRTPFSTAYIYASSAHLRRVVALHGSVMPPVIDTLLRAADALPALAARETLLSHGVTRVVIHRALMTGDSALSLISAFRLAGYPILFDGREGVVFATAASHMLPEDQ
jgi:hypothetical protein